MQSAMDHFDEMIRFNREISLRSAGHRVEEYEQIARREGSCKMPASEFEKRTPTGSVTRGPVYVLWFQDRKEYSYLISAIPSTVEDAPPMVGVSREDLVKYIASVLEDQNRITFSDGNGVILGWGTSPDRPNGLYTWQGIGDQYPREITRESAESYLAGNGIRYMRDIKPHLSGMVKEDVSGETMEAFGSFEGATDQSERHAMQAQTYGELLQKNIFEVISYGEKQCLKGERRPATVDPTVYYMNRKNGTEFDFRENDHVSPFMVFHKNGRGYMKVLFSADDTLHVYMYRHGESKPDRECTATLDEGTGAKIAGLMKEKADDRNLWDRPLSAIDCRAERVQPMDRHPADNILPFVARS